MAALPRRCQPPLLAISSRHRRRCSGEAEATGSAHTRAMGSLRYRAYWIGMFSSFLASIVICNSIGAGAPVAFIAFTVRIAIASLVVWFPILGCCMMSCNEFPWLFPNWLEMLAGPYPPVTFSVVGGDATELSVVVGGPYFQRSVSHWAASWALMCTRSRLRTSGPITKMAVTMEGAVIT